MYETVINNNQNESLNKSDINDKRVEIKDLLSIQNELLKKLSRKEEEISLLKIRIDKIK
jgi:hypothetical protein